MPLRRLEKAAGDAAKWSLAAELIAKIIIPVTQLVLARLLAPSAFGILAIVLMVASFGQMLADAGFSKYLVQHDFEDQKTLRTAANVSFWSSMAAALVLMALVIVFRDGIAVFAGAPGLGVPIAVASISVPLSVVVSTQQALFRREFEYKKLLPVRASVAATPLLIAVPLAVLGFDYWSLIAGTIAASIVNAGALTLMSPWKPGLEYSWQTFRTMFSFSAWTLVESVSIWMSLWAGPFIVGALLTPTELGLYRQPILVVNSVFAIITGATTPILFAALSRLQNDLSEYRRFFFEFQFLVSIVVLPMGVGAFFYRNFFTDLLFGAQWHAAALMFGLWGLTTGLSIVLSHYCSEVFRSLGRPKISVLSQCLYMLIMIPTLYIAALHGFTVLVIANAIVRVAAMGIGQTLTYLIAGFGLLKTLRNIYVPLTATIIMAVVACLLAGLANDNWLSNCLGIIGCVAAYTAVCVLFPRSRALIIRISRKITNRVSKDRIDMTGGWTNEQ